MYSYVFGHLSYQSYQKLRFFELLDSQPGVCIDRFSNEALGVEVRGGTP